MRWFTIGILFFAHCSFAQVTIQGTVRPSFNPDTTLSDANVQFYKLAIVGTDTQRTLIGTVLTDRNGYYTTQLVTGVSKSDPPVPQEFELSDSYPNPFDTKTQIGLQVPTHGEFTVSVYNILGQRMTTARTPLTAGAYTISWQGADIPGVYFAAIRNEGKTKIVKIIQLTRNSVTFPLQISASPAGLRAKRTTAASPSTAGILQVTVSKPLYQMFASPLLTFANQTVDAALRYAGSGTISSAKRDSSRRETGAQFRFLNASLPKLEAAKAMVDWLKQQPQFEDAGTGIDGNVWGRFIDGTSVIFINNPSVAKTAGSSGRIETLPKSYSAGQPSNIPMSNSLYISSSFGPVYMGTDVSVSALCEKTGYTTTWASTVDLLKGVKDAGVYFEFGHGGYGAVPTGGSEFAVWTATKCTDANDTVYADDLKEHRLVEMYALYDYPANAAGTWDTVMSWNYAYTGQFVRKYMSFSKNSLAFIGSCYSATNNVFVNSFLVKGASMFAGFTDTWYADFFQTCALTFFDRVLGVNGGKPSVEDPPQRPFDGPAVLAWMKDNNLDWGAANGTAKLVLVSQSGNANPCGPLAPSIASMFVHPYEQKLYIYGIFGDNPGGDGQVTIGGMPSEVQEWSYFDQAQMDRIICKIPDDGAGSYGDVQVTVRKIKSNVSQLSRYIGNFTLTHETTDGRQYVMKLTPQLRVHLLGFRMKPHEKPVFNQNTYVVHADMGSKGESTANGSTGGAVFWSGHNAELHNNIDGGSAPAGYIAGAWFDPEQMKMQFYMSGGVQNGITQTIGTQSTGMPIIVGVDEFNGKNPNFPSYAEVKLNSDFSITKGKATATKVAMYYSMMAPMADQVKIEWDDIKCDAPPTPKTPR
jgi:hypothetical protein